MTEEKRGSPPPRGGPGGGPGRGPGGGPGGGRDNRGGGGRDGGGRGGPRKSGGFGKGPVKQARAETYESLKELTRGEGFRIDKYVVAEKGTHKLVKTEYRLTREGLKGVPGFQRLVDAQAAAIAPLPEPEPEPEIVEEAAPETVAAEGEAAADEAPEAVHDESAPAETEGEPAHPVAAEEPAA